MVSRVEYTPCAQLRLEKDGTDSQTDRQTDRHQIVAFIRGDTKVATILPLGVRIKKRLGPVCG